jgi:hypothetical protein
MQRISDLEVSIERDVKYSQILILIVHLWCVHVREKKRERERNIRETKNLNLSQNERNPRLDSILKIGK